MGALTGLPALELARLVAAREASALEIVDAHLRLIEVEDGAIGAVVQLDAERAVATARRADAARAVPGATAGPLDGVPFTVKDTIAAAGLPMTMGAPERAGAPPPAADATVVARMRAAGAILLGKTNCPPYGGGIETENPVHGRTVNPYDRARTAGGSSGGEAAALAAGLSACGLGTDSGGSLRLPAHCCGVAALKPSAGRVPLTGVLDDEGPLGALADPRTQAGPLARSAADLALVLRAVAGPDGADAGLAPVALGDPAAVELRGARVAVQLDNGLAPPTAETVAAVEAAASVLAAAGCVRADAAIPAGGHELTIEVWRSHGDGLDAPGLWRLLRRWDAFRSAMLGFAARYDLLLTPVFDGPARPHGEMNRPGEMDPTSWTTPHSLTGWPAATVRAGTSPEGLPVGVQVVAGPWRDDVALAAAMAIERGLGPFPGPR